MPFYSREICEEVRSRNDIVDVISGYIRLENRGGRYFGLCPFHTEKTPSFSVSPDMQIYHCFGCHASGNVVSFLMQYDNLGFTEAIEVLAEKAGMKIESAGYDDSGARRQREALLAANKAAAEYFFHLLRGEEGKLALAYFKDRGLGRGVLSSFGLGYSGKGGSGLHNYLTEKGFSDQVQKDAGLIVFDERSGIRDRFFNRVMFPIMDQNNKVIAFGGRVMGDGKPKYINSSESPIFNKSKTIYGLFAARRTRRPNFILCEGYMDVISAHQAGFDNCIATLGTAFTEGHAVILKRYKRPVLLCYDMDTAGRAAAAKCYEILRTAGIAAKIMDITPYKDPDEFIKAMGKDAFEERITEAKNAFIVLRRWEYEQTDAADPDAMTAFTHELAYKISRFTDESERDNYIRFCAGEFGINADMLRRMVNSAGNRNFTTPPIRTGAAPRKKEGINREDALASAEGALLYFLLEEHFYNLTAAYIEREDFTDEQLREVYDMITGSIKAGKVPDAADLISAVEDDESRNRLSESFFKAQDSIEVSSDPAKIKRMTLLRVKKAAIKRQNADIDPTDVRKMQEALEYAKETIDDIEKLKF